jgi:ABC-type Na+ transport system ATPase subunit NatA
LVTLDGVRVKVHLSRALDHQARVVFAGVPSGLDVRPTIRPLTRRDRPVAVWTLVVAP